MEYTDKLKDPRWQKKRLEILKRDDWACQSCFDIKSTLAVHHKSYIPNSEPWDYPDELLITLCETCPKRERETRDEAEQELLLVLREHFLVNQIKYLTDGFTMMNILTLPDIQASAIQWLLSDHNELQAIIQKYKIDMLKTARENAKGRQTKIKS